MSSWSDLGFNDAEAEEIENAYMSSNLRGTNAFIRGLNILTKYQDGGLDRHILHAERGVILVYVDRWNEVSYEDAMELSSLCFSVDDEFGECWRYYASL